MDNKVLKIYINSLSDVKEELIQHTNNIMDNLQAVTSLVSNISEIFDSKAGKEYDRLINDFIRKTKNDIESNNTYLITKLNDISNTYWEIYQDVKESVSNSNMENES